jgi:predicted Zn finger-like uncharacterized protein
MSIATMCPHCSRRYAVKPEHVGKKVSCKGCGQTFVIEDIAGTERTPSGAPVYRPERAASTGHPSATPYLEQIQAHIERTIGPVSGVFHEIVSDAAHVDLHIVPPQPHIPQSQERPLGGDFYTIVTSGMSWKPMNIPPKSLDNGVSPYGELMIALPKDWSGMRPDGSFDQQMMQRDENWWPLRWLKQMARLPHEYNTFYSNGVTVPNGEPAAPFVAGTDLCCWMVLKPLLAPKAKSLVISDNVRIDFFALIALTQAEMDLKLNKGPGELLKVLAEGEVCELLNPHSQSPLKKKGWFGR